LSSLHDPESAKEVVDSYTSWLGGTFDSVMNPVSDPGALHPSDFVYTAGVLALVVTGGTERLIQSTAGLGCPVMILTHESMNSLPAALEAVPSLGRLHPPQIAFGQNEIQLDKVKRFVDAARTLRRIRNHRIGLVGGPSPWLTYSVPNEKALANRLGVEIITLSMEEFDNEYENANQRMVASLASQVDSGIPVSDGIGREDFNKSARIGIALQNIIGKHKLTSVSVRCFDFIGKYRATGCYGISLLNDKGTVAGCEGDIPATVAMITLSEVAHSPTFLANPTFIRGHTLIIAHCTIAPKLTVSYRYRTHFESGLGVAISGALREGERVTVVRFSNDFGTLRAGEGSITRGQAWSEKLCRTQAEIAMDGDAELIKEHPMGNHVVITYGNHVDSLRELAALADLNFEKIE
jgi:L-fucose isomerase-like protein